MEQRSRCRRTSFICVSGPVALKLVDEGLQFFLRYLREIALGQIRAAALESAYSARSFPTSFIICARDLAMRSPTPFSSRRTTGHGADPIFLQ
jgi:hypothetical protein